MKYNLGSFKTPNYRFLNQAKMEDKQLHLNPQINNLKNKLCQMIRSTAL